MNKLPPAAAGLLKQTREADLAQAVDFERTLAKLHATLAFADVGIGGPAGDGGASTSNLPPAAAAGAPNTLGVGALVASKGAKLVLVTLALGGALGGTLMLRGTSEPPTARAPVAERRPTASDSSAPSATRAKPLTKQAAGSEPGLDAPPPLATFGATGDAPAREAKPRETAAKAQRGDAAVHSTTLAEQADNSKAKREARSSTTSDPSTPDPSDAPVKGAKSRKPLAETPAERELDLIDAAFADLREGEPARALALLERHRALYPSGTFTTERQGLRVLALCAVGRVEEGRAEQATFLLRAPSSPIAARVRNACEPNKDRP